MIKNFHGNKMKTGKTTTAASFDKALILAFEVGYLTIPGVMAQKVSSWSEFKKILRQLKTDEVKDKFSNIVIDTADIAWSLCEKYICMQNDVDSIGDLPFGKGYSLLSKEFDEAMRSIPQMNYGLIFISHSEDKTFKDESGDEYNQIVPTLPNRGRLIVDRMSDVIGYAHPIQEEDGTTHTTLYMRGTPRFIAGSRFKYTPESIDFSYDNLVNAIHDAIDEQAKESNGELVTDKAPEVKDTPKYNYNEVMDEFGEVVGKIQEATGSKFETEWAPRIVQITDKVLGKGKKVSECTPDQAELIAAINDELIEQINQGL